MPYHYTYFVVKSNCKLYAMQLNARLGFAKALDVQVQLDEMCIGSKESFAVIREKAEKDKKQRLEERAEVGLRSLPFKLMRQSTCLKAVPCLQF